MPVGIHEMAAEIVLTGCEDPEKVLGPLSSAACELGRHGEDAIGGNKPEVWPAGDFKQRRDSSFGVGKWRGRAKESEQATSGMPKEGTHGVEFSGVRCG